MNSGMYVKPEPGTVGLSPCAGGGGGGRPGPVFLPHPAENGGVAGGPLSNSSNPGSESGYSSLGGDTPSSGKSHSPVTSAGNPLLMQKDIKPDIAQLNLMGMMSMNGHVGAGGVSVAAASGMSTYLHNLSTMANMNGDLGGVTGAQSPPSHPPTPTTHHPQLTPAHTTHINGFNLNNHGNGMLSPQPQQHTNGLSNGVSPGGFDFHAPQPGHDPFVLAQRSHEMEALADAEAVSPPPGASPHHSSGSSPGGHTPTRAVMSPTSTQLSPPVGACSTTMTPLMMQMVQLKVEPLPWDDRPPCGGAPPRGTIPPPTDEHITWVLEVRPPRGAPLLQHVTSLRSCFCCSKRVVNSQSQHA